MLKLPCPSKSFVSTGTQLVSGSARLVLASTTYCVPGVPLAPVMVKVWPDKAIVVNFGGVGAAPATMDIVPVAARLFVFQANPGPGVAGVMAENEPLIPSAAWKSVKLLLTARLPESTVNDNVPPSVKLPPTESVSLVTGPDASFIIAVPPRMTLLVTVRAPTVVDEPGAIVAPVPVVTMPLTVPKPLSVCPAASRRSGFGPLVLFSFCDKSKIELVVARTMAAWLEIPQLTPVKARVPFSTTVLPV